MPTLEITTMIGCPLKCTFCPQTELKGAYEKENDPKNKETRYLSLENFKRIIDKLPKHVRIDFSGMAEPWANPQCTEMLRYALDSGFKVAVFSTLYGMTEADADIVIDLLKLNRDRIDVLCIHLPDANGNMLGWRHSREWEEVCTKFIALRTEDVIQRFSFMTMDGSGRLHDSLNHLSIGMDGWTGHTRAGTLDDAQMRSKDYCAQTPRHDSAVGCRTTPFYDHNVVLPNGDVVLCCMDYGLKHVIGNILTGKYEDLFRSEAMNDLRQTNMTPEFSKCSLCKSCTDATAYSVGYDARWLGEKDAQLAEYLYHLDRINASPWWQFGMWLNKEVLAPLRRIGGKKPDTEAR